MIFNFTMENFFTFATQYTHASEEIDFFIEEVAFSVCLVKELLHGRNEFVGVFTTQSIKITTFL